MAATKFHIKRRELELGSFSETETRDLLAVGFLLPTDEFLVEGDTVSRPLAELPPTVRSETPVWATLAATVVVKTANTVRDKANTILGGASGVARASQAGLSASKDRVMEDYLPRLRESVAAQLQRAGQVADSALKDEEFLRKLFGAVHDCLPRPVRRFVGEEQFIEFCLKHRYRLLAGSANMPKA